jgi:hypothetical protein
MIERDHLRNTASATRLLTLTLTLTIAIAPLLPAEAIAAPADQDHNSHGSAVLAAPAMAGKQQAPVTT